MGKTSNKRRSVPKPVKMPTTIYVLFHEDKDNPDDSWYEVRENYQDFTDEGPVAVYSMTGGSQANLKIKNVIEKEN